MASLEAVPPPQPEDRRALTGLRFAAAMSIVLLHRRGVSAREWLRFVPTMAVQGGALTGANQVADALDQKRFQPGRAHRWPVIGG
jgi:hypothetical protein